MQHFESLDDIHLQHTWLTIGAFDGVHLGHQQIIRALTRGAQLASATPVVLTFYPHPALVLGKRNLPFYLNSPEEKAAILSDLGVDVVITHPFNQEVANMSARSFIESTVQRLGMKHLLVGPNFALGRGREGTIPVLQALGDELGYHLEVVNPVLLNGEVISSTLVRSALAAGQVEATANMLGRPYSLTGEVIHGDGRGRTIGIPTANLMIWAERALPAAGVYACRAILDGRVWKAVTNVGVRPTFENQPVLPRVETHLLDFDRDLYTIRIQLEFITRLRGEQRFASAADLVRQIHLDIQSARQIL